MASTDERTPLIGADRNGYESFNGDQAQSAERHSKKRPTWKQSANFLFFGSKFNLLLAILPFALASRTFGFSTNAQFILSFLAIMPLAKLMGDTTEQVAHSLGDKTAGLLNATMGNAIEVIVGIVGVKNGQLELVQASMLGSVLSNILLVLGCSLTAAGLKRDQSSFNSINAQVASSLMTLSCITIMIPAAYYHLHNVVDKDTADIPKKLNFFSRGTSLLLLAVYGAYIWFTLFGPTHEGEQDQGENGGIREEEAEVEEPEMNLPSAAIGLCAVTVVTAWCADILLGVVEEFAQENKIPQAFIAFILLPIVANAAEHATAVVMATKDRMDLALGICVGSSIQISIFVVPLLVMIGWGFGQPLTLFFSSFETIVLFISVILVSQLLQDGKSNIMEGIMLITLYAVIGMAAWIQ